VRRAPTTASGLVPVQAGTLLASSPTPQEDTMPGKQNVPASKTSGKGAVARKPPQSAPAPRTTEKTGERDENYALISLLYHTLQGADTINKYIEDARRAGDDELVSFFEESRESYVELAQEAKLLLASRLGEGTEEDEEDEDEDDDEEDDEEEDEEE
jgi:hypothetical protein